MSYYSEGRNDEAVYVRLYKDYDPETAEISVREMLAEFYPDLVVDDVERRIEFELIYRAEDEVTDLLECIKHAAPKSMWPEDRKWVGRDEFILYRNYMYEIRLCEEDTFYVIVFALRTDYEPWYDGEKRLRNLAVGNLRRTAKGFFSRLHEKYGYNLHGNLLGFDFLYREGLSRKKQEKLDKKLIKPSGSTTIKVGNVQLLFHADKWIEPTITVL